MSIETEILNIQDRKDLIYYSQRVVKGEFGKATKKVKKAIWKRIKQLKP